MNRALVPFGADQPIIVSPEVEAALANAPPEIVREIKGTIWRVRALQTAREPLIEATRAVSMALREQAAIRPLNFGEAITGEVAFRADQDQDGWCGSRHGVNNFKPW